MNIKTAAMWKLSVQIFRFALIAISRFMEQLILPAVIKIKPVLIDDYNTILSGHTITPLIYQLVGKILEKVRIKNRKEF